MRFVTPCHRGPGTGRLAAVQRAGSAAALVVGMAVLLAGVGLAGACGTTSHAQQQASAAAEVRAAQARTVARQAGLGGDVQDFLARAAGAGSVTYTVVYDQGGGQTTTVIARPPDRRIDIQSATGPGSVDRVLINGTATYLCHLTSGPWRCSSGVTATPAGPFTPDAITQTIASLARLSQRYDFKVSGRAMVGLQARCLTADRKAGLPADPTVGDHAAICIAASGVILRIEDAGTTLQATSYRTSVPARAFDLPARPVPLPPQISAPSPTLGPTLPTMPLPVAGSPPSTVPAG
jgi:hypothetical protein